ncbi:MAG: 4-hydroxy-tetrahydrodipicolinate synthase [Clostridiales bacterium]|jgi:4-hydroxy-tetrahydrodipicolinate synthase|nr:4-hydroxy-tetrahydrodipicolinate synthase [Clostridiales bacterium]
MNTPLFKGCGTAIITPFTSQGIDYSALEKLIEFQINQGADALIVLGTTGEAAAMTAAEKTDVIKFAVSKTAKRIPVIIGTGSNCTETAAENSAAAEKLGADGLLVVTPYYNKCTQGGLVAHFNAVADRVGIPIVVYNVPKRTGVDISAETFAKMCEHKNIQAIKEASGNLEQIAEMSRLTRGKAFIYSGDDSLIIPVMSVGGIGVISVASNVAPKYFKEMTAYALNGDHQKALDMQLNALPFIKALFLEINPIPVKAAAKLLGLSNGILRLPLTDIEESNLVRLKKEMTDFGLIPS